MREVYTKLLCRDNIAAGGNTVEIIGQKDRLFRPYNRLCVKMFGMDLVFSQQREKNTHKMKKDTLKKVKKKKRII